MAHQNKHKLLQSSLKQLRVILFIGYFWIFLQVVELIPNAKAPPSMYMPTSAIDYIFPMILGVPPLITLTIGIFLRWG